MDFLNKAKHAAEKYAGGDMNNGGNKHHKKGDSDSLFAKAKDAADKYHGKDKAPHGHGHGDKKDKSTVDKAMEAAESYLAKQGTHKSHHSGGKDNQKDDMMAKAKEAAAKYSKMF